MQTVLPTPGLRNTADVGGAIAALVEALGHDCVLTGPALQSRHLADWSEAPAAEPGALLLPKTPAQVALALAICSWHRQPLAVLGGLTGLAGGANPQPGEFALSLSRLNAIEDFDGLGGTVLVQAGVTLEQLQTAVAEQGWFFPLDLGARGSCHLGGNAATNAGGNRVLRHGMMRQSILGLEVALADGTLLTMLDRVIKNNAGFDLKQLFIGSEGCLGVITRLCLKLEPATQATGTVLCALEGFRQSALLLARAKARLPELSAFELIWDDCLRAGAKAIGRAPPFGLPYPLYVLIETGAANEAAGRDALERFLCDAMEDGIVTDAIVAHSAQQAAQLWHYREAVSELLALTKPCAAFDVSVAMPAMEGFVQELREHLLRHYPAQHHYFFGHLGDGNLHLISGPYPEPTDLLAVEDAVYRCVGRHKGSISAEHGIGVVKKDFLLHSRSADEIALMGRLRMMLDPLRILNRGRVQ